jgi:hypothetical protein
MANKPITVDDLLDEIGEHFEKSVDAQVAGMPDTLDDAIDAAQMYRKVKGNYHWDGKPPVITATDSVFDTAIKDRQQWLKETEHNRLIAYTEANRLAVEVFKSTVTPGGLVETTEEIIKSAAKIAAFLNEGKIK